MSVAIRNQVQIFALVGVFGFTVDAGILSLLHSALSIDIIPARFASFLTAVTCTWWLNRNRTFYDIKNAEMMREWGRYTIVNGAGGAINMGIFFWLIDRYTLFSEFPLLSLAVASAIAMVFNFIASKYIAFQGTRT